MWSDVCSPQNGMIHRERDQFEAELKDLTRRFETLDLNHAALTRERNTLSKEVLTTSTSLEASELAGVPQRLSISVLFSSSRWQRCSSQ